MLKGPETIVASPADVVLVKGGNPGMTKGGTGDVLAGLCAGLLAQGMDLFEAAQLASSINKLIGDKRAKTHGYSYLASELAEDLKKGKKIKKKLP